jgi:hypothetical protein
MKALSIRQPWAWLIANGHKPVENRTWNTKHRGPFLIHAGLAFDTDGYHWVKQAFPAIQMPEIKDFPTGGIVGKADLVDCIPPGSNLDSDWYFGDYGFMVADAKPLPFKKLRGKLNFFESHLPD